MTDGCPRTLEASIPETEIATAIENTLEAAVAELELEVTDPETTIEEIC